MGQATIDLPDPTNQPNAPANSADDLLAQLAGDEIDRLLAANDNSPKEPADAADVAPMTSEALTEQLLAPAAVETEKPAVAPMPPAPATPAPSAKTAEMNEAYAAQIDTLFKELNAVELKPPIVDEPEPAQPMLAAAATPVVETPPPVEQATTAEEVAALTSPIEQPAADAIAAVVETLPEEKTSILVRLLEIINAPFAAVPDPVRDMLGKVAILTIMNSVGVLLYLMLFRKHH